VKEFSTLKPPQLLSATEQAINKDSHDAHELLVRDFGEQRMSEQQLIDLRSNLGKYEAQCKQMQSDVERFRQVEDCKKMIEKYRKKIPWVAFQVERDQRGAVKKELHERIKHYKAIGQETIQPLTEQIEALQRQRGNFAKARENVSRANAAIGDLGKSLFQTESKLQNTRAKLSAIGNDLAAKQHKIEQLRHALEQAQQSGPDGPTLEKLRETQSRLSKEQHKVKLAETEINTARMAAEHKISQTTTKLNEVNARMKAFDNQRNRLLDHIGSRLRRQDVVEMHRYIQSHRTSFVGQVFGPICAEMTFDDPRSANVIQKVVETRYLYAFVVEDSRDFDTLHRHMQEMNISGITLLRKSDDGRSQPQQPPDLGPQGFPHYCSELFRAPDVVKSVLLQLTHIDRVPVGAGGKARDAVARLMDSVFPSHRINRYILDDIMYIIYKRRSGGRPITVSAPVGTSSIWREAFARADDLTELRERQTALQQKLEHYRSEQEAVRDRAQQHRRDLIEATQQLQEVKEEISKRSRLEEKIAQIREKITEYERECRNVPAKQTELKTRLAELIEAKIQINENTLKALHKVVHATKELDCITVKDNAIENQLSELQERLDQQKAEYAELEQKILDLNNELKSKDASIKKKKEEAEKICPLTDENKEMMAELPGDLEVLKAELARHQTRLASLAHIDPTIAARFREIQQKRDDTQAKVSEVQASIEEKQTVLMQRFAQWKDGLVVELRKINRAFQDLMATCEYRGEVRLDWDEPDKIETYRLSLLVAFDRTSPLNILTATRQSGGEKSVTTLLYLLALQDCTKFPFRVVDEINQGMDEVNDRNTFLQVMSHAMRRNQASQYFLVTPKLLPQLDLLDGVTVLVVMNGPFIPDELSTPITFDNAFGIA
jgi:chromosome segregation ATPase